MRRTFTTALAGLALLGAVEAQAGTKTQTKYPIVLVPGVTGNDTSVGMSN